MSIQNAPIYVAYSELHGKGVFAARDIEAGEIVEICPVILFGKDQLPHVRQTVLDDYYFDWGDDETIFAFALGYGSLYNHSYEPNAEYGMDFEAETIDIYCIKDIAAGGEILINYNGIPDDQTIVWFEKK
ncbi:MAG: SET domain-containing protein-lysine N-methyltransferase [Lewinellaceae bacterium]|nr:SET domain-containing protein-lysine N-methyltransferase [Lewinellaceae bacterium]